MEYRAPWNTLIKMAQKRALVGAALNAVAGSGLFVSAADDADDNRALRRRGAHRPRRRPMPAPRSSGHTRVLRSFPPCPSRTGPVRSTTWPGPAAGASTSTHWSIHSDAGWPDLALVRPPRFIAAELKSDRGQLTDDQAQWLDLLDACAGVEAYVWRPADWDRVVEALW